MAIPLLPILAAGGALIFLLGKGTKKTAITPKPPFTKPPVIPPTPYGPPAIPPTPWTPPAIPPITWPTPPTSWTAPPPPTGWVPPPGWIPPWVSAEAKSKEPGVVADDFKLGFNHGFSDAAYSSDFGTSADKAKYASSLSYKNGYDAGYKEYGKSVTSAGVAGVRAGLDVMSFEDPRFMMYVRGPFVPHVAGNRVGMESVERPADIRGFSHIHRAHPAARRTDLRRSAGRTRVNVAVSGAAAAGCCPGSPGAYDAPSGCQCPACQNQYVDAYGNRIDQTTMLRMLQYAGWRR
jgi:hypothetical protein